ncbi:MAG: class I SAM-dependent methyltransferase [Verrucomicrobia bacterium]|nr:class I SAM-dependent methyltransferase [Verrucomicrobiota bacterium]
MKRFRYALDPLCVGACVAYAVCRWVIRPHWTGLFWHGYSTDCLFIPAALPLLLWVQRQLGLRSHDRYPDWPEIGINFAVWSVAAEGVAPFIFKTAVGDWMDVVAYASGALVAGVWWTFAGRTGFDRLAPHYGWMEKFLAGPRLQRCRTQWFDQLAGARRILIVGVGHAPELQALTVRCPAAHFTCVDASAGMLAAAEARVHRDGLDPTRLTFIHAALPAWQPPAGEYDAIVTNFFLDCFSGEELSAVVHRLATAAAPEARWVISDFTVPPRGLARLRARFVHALMYVFFRVVTGLRAARLTEPDPLLTAEGFTLTGRQTSEWGLLHADLWSRGPR